LVLALNNGAEDLSITAHSTSFAFTTRLLANQAYNITVKQQPGVPSQTCVVAGGVGSVTANVTTVAVNCTTLAYSIQGNLSGLMAGGTLVLQLNGGPAYPLTNNGAFSFPTQVSSGNSYAVTISQQPGSQTCVVTGGTGTVGASAVTVVVNCDPARASLGGVVNQLEGMGLTLVEANGGTATPSSSGSFLFPSTLALGTTYSVSVLHAPSNPTQDCTLMNATGVIGPSSSMAVTVNCMRALFGVSGAVSGLPGGQAVTVTLNATPLTGGLPVWVADAFVNSTQTSQTFNFPASVMSGVSWSIVARPQNPVPVTSCSVMNGSGVMGGANVSNVAITCAALPFTVGGTISNLRGNGLTLSNSTNGEALNVAGNATTFTFVSSLASGSTYNVSVQANPTSPSQSCSVDPGTGIGLVGPGAVTSIGVTCVTQSFQFSGSVSGLNGALTLSLNGAGSQQVSMNSNGSFFFGMVLSGTSYNVQVASQPPSQRCTVTNGMGVVGGTDINNVAVVCQNLFPIHGTAMNISAPVVLTLNGGEQLTVPVNATAFNFFTRLVEGTNYMVTLAQPAGHTCQVMPASGMVQATTSLSLNCTTP
jgi:hypothetical protein